MAAIFEKRKTFVQKKPVICHFIEVFYKHLATFINTTNSLRKMIPKQWKAVARHVKTDLLLTLFSVIQHSFSDLQTFALS